MSTTQATQAHDKRICDRRDSCLAACGGVVLQWFELWGFAWKCNRLVLKCRNYFIFSITLTQPVALLYYTFLFDPWLLNDVFRASTL